MHGIGFKQIKYIYYEKKQSDTLIEQACAKVTGFSELLHQFKQKISIAGKSESTYLNYARQLSQLALHFDCLPTELDPAGTCRFILSTKECHSNFSLVVK